MAIRRPSCAGITGPRVVLTDLRGRGESHKPQPGARLARYAKRTMSAEMRNVMRSLGHNRFAVVGHDHSARVARRMALDHPKAVRRLVVMDIVPGLDFDNGLRPRSRRTPSTSASSPRIIRSPRP